VNESNTALWLTRPGTAFEVGPAPAAAPGKGEIAVRVRALGLNFVDAMPAFGYRVVLPWLRFPAIVGSDVAGEVIAIGDGVTRFEVGDRVLGHAVGVERNRNRAAEGAFQLQVVLSDYMSTPIPDAMSFEEACVLPLTLSTAATGLFQHDHLGLALPSAAAAPRGEWVLVWGGATAVGSNAIQLARNAGYDVVATASSRNAGHLRDLGASAVDRTSRTAVKELLAIIGDKPVAGSIAIGSGSLGPTIQVAARSNGSRRVVTAQPDRIARVLALAAGAPFRGVSVSGIWGGTLKDNEVGPAIYQNFLPGALASGAYRAAPSPKVVGHGLAAIPDALKQVRGVSAQKIVVTV